MRGQMMGQVDDSVSMKKSDPVRNKMGIASKCKAQAPAGH